MARKAARCGLTWRALMKTVFNALLFCFPSTYTPAVITCSISSHLQLQNFNHFSPFRGLKGSATKSSSVKKKKTLTCWIWAVCCLFQTVRYHFLPSLLLTRESPWRVLSLTCHKSSCQCFSPTAGVCLLSLLHPHKCCQALRIMHSLLVVHHGKVWGRSTIHGWQQCVRAVVQEVKTSG